MNPDRTVSPPSDAHCPACERFIGPAPACGYCGCDARRAPLRRALRLGALVLALAGLGFVYLLARRTGPAPVAVESIRPTMNYAALNVAGSVAGRPYVKRVRGRVDYLSFTLDDGTGRLRVAARAPVAGQLVDRGLLPRKGDRVQAAGRVHVSAYGRPSLYLMSARHLQRLTRPEAASRGGPAT
jgi:hypothetical protein